MTEPPRQYPLIHKIRANDHVSNIRIVEIHPGLERHIYRKGVNKMCCYCFVVSTFAGAKKYWNMKTALEAYNMATLDGVLDVKSVAGRQGCGTIPLVIVPPKKKRSVPKPRTVSVPQPSTFASVLSAAVSSSSSSSSSSASTVSSASLLSSFTNFAVPTSSATTPSFSINPLPLVSTPGGPVDPKKRKRKVSNNKTGYRGVCKVGEKFKVTIYTDKKLKYLGMYNTAWEGAVAYDLEAMKYLDLQHCLNFPNGIPEGVAKAEAERQRLNSDGTQRDGGKKRRLNTRNTTGYTGVSKIGRKHKSQISVDGKTEYIGTFNTAYEAAKAYDERALFHNPNIYEGDLNFPRNRKIAATPITTSAGTIMAGLNNGQDIFSSANTTLFKVVQVDYDEEAEDEEAEDDVEQAKDDRVVEKIHPEASSAGNMDLLLSVITNTITSDN